MSLSELTDPEAVLRAISEFDDIGREAFLAKYGFGPARTYFLLHNSRRYDSKAIVGAAHGLQHPDRPPLKGKDFSGGESTVRKKLRALGFDVERGGDPTAPKRNPPWSRDETILALDLYIRRRPQLPGENDREILELSSLLNLQGAQRGVSAMANFRNPDGVSMKVANLSRLDPSSGRKGLPHGAAMEDQVWAEFMPDITKLRHAAEEVTRRIKGADGPSPIASLTAAASENLTLASRGPAPTFGQVVQNRVDGETCVYIMRLTGRVADYFSQHDLRGRAVVKVGRSNEVSRRAFELNCGFPPGLDLAWVPVQFQTFATGILAHDREQATLRHLERLGLSIGGEFAIVPENQIDGLLDATAEASD
ncbi:MAG: hypothetical protein V4759_03105 [Pseudomonadota bacterium]